MFYVGTGNGDNQNDYSGTDIVTNGIKGYVVALNDAGAYNWAKTDDVAEKAITSTAKDAWNGYSNMNIVKNVNLSDYPAFDACVNFVPSAPGNCSGWYLPSKAQLENAILNKDSFMSSLQNIPKLQDFLSAQS